MEQNNLVIRDGWVIEMARKITQETGLTTDQLMRTALLAYKMDYLDKFARMCRPKSTKNPAAATTGQKGNDGAVEAKHSQNNHTIAGTAIQPKPRFGIFAGTTWRKRVRASTAMLRKPRGWTYDVADVAIAEAAGIEALEMTDTETGTVWRATFGALGAYGVTVDRGHGPQRCLPEYRWEIVQPEG